MLCKYEGNLKTAAMLCKYEGNQKTAAMLFRERVVSMVILANGEA